jgi:hypothetical protein
MCCAAGGKVTSVCALIDPIGIKPAAAAALPKLMAAAAVGAIHASRLLGAAYLDPVAVLLYPHPAAPSHSQQYCPGAATTLATSILKYIV